MNGCTINIMKSKYKGLFCSVPFEFVYLDHHGNLNPHCEGLVDCSMGNLKENDFFDVWNSDTAQKIRESILDQSFQFCDEKRCFALRERKLPNAEKINNQVHRDIIKNKLIVLKKGPKAVNFGYDCTCNLNCQSCRKEYFVSHDDLKAEEAVHQKAISKYLKDTKRLILSGMGDPFASRLYRKFLKDFNTKEFPALKIQIVTNGLLLTQNLWKTLSNCYGAIDKISISFDAATEKTYKKIRGGDFKTLIKNMEFISRIRQKNLIKDLCIDFVVQASNYKEMKLFVEMGKEFKCDYVAFKHIDNWGTYTEEEFKDIAVHNPSHPEHSDFLEILADPVMKDPIVWLRNLVPFLPVEYREDGFLGLCDYEVYNMLLNDMEWEFFVSTLSLSDSQSLKIREILNKLQNEIKEMDEELLTLESIPAHFAIDHGMVEVFSESQCEEYAPGESDSNGNSSFTTVERVVSETQNEIMLVLSKAQQSMFQQIIRIKPLTEINTGFINEVYC